MDLHPSVLTGLLTELKKKKSICPSRPSQFCKITERSHLDGKLNPTLFWFQDTQSVLYYTLGFSVVSFSHKSIWQSHYKQFRKIQNAGA